MEKNPKKWLKRITFIVGGIASVMAIPYIFTIGVYLFVAASFILTDITAPTPPSPEVLTAKFHYELRYEIDGVEKFHNNTMICSFKGIEQIASGAGKKRTWDCVYESKPTVEALGVYRIICYPKGSAGYYMGDPDAYKKYENELEIEVNYNGRRNLSEEEKQEFFNEHNFKIISQTCDPPIENTFQ
uniref:Uncharacterized protein n=1 Tax=uncultured Bacillota bacterium TaxID=344338 RepID=A0A650EPL5_9FIRM|nr:hypothetical protein Firmicute1046_3570 [uncultured Firmicutes bacterium]